MEDQILSVEDILNMGDNDDVEYRVVDVPNWPKTGQTGKVRLGQCNGEQLTKWSDDNDKDRKTAGIRILALSLQAGSEVEVTDEQASKLVAVISKRAGARINQLVQEALDLNELTEKKVAAAKNESGEAAAGASPIS